MSVPAVASILCAVVVTFLAWTSYRLSSVLRGMNHTTLTFSPHELRMGEVFLAILYMMIKSLSRTVHGSQSSSNAPAAARLTLSSPFRISKEDVVRYNKAIGLTGASKSDVDPFSLPLFLAAVTEPAMLLLLSSPRCPINPLGAVNVRNRFEVLRPELCNLDSFRDNHAAGLIARSRNDGRLVKRGTEYDLDVSIMVPDNTSETHGTLVVVFRQVFTMLEFRAAKKNAENKVREESKSDTQALMSAGSPIRVSFSKSEPLKWVALCKDYNFIHLSTFAAKAFGLPGKLAHGNHIVAKALEKSKENDTLQQLGDEPMWMEVQFKRPVVIPCNLDIQVRSTTTGVIGFAVSNRGRGCVIVDHGLM